MAEATIAGGVHAAEFLVLLFGEFWLLAAQLALAHATAIPSRVRMRMRSVSNPAELGRILKNILPSGSWIIMADGELHLLALQLIGNVPGTGTELARRSGFGTARVSPLRNAAIA